MSDTTVFRDHGNPYLLDTPEKVEWANALREQMDVGLPWRLGDHCWYRPAKNISSKTAKA